MPNTNEHLTYLLAKESLKMKFDPPEQQPHTPQIPETVNTVTIKNETYEVKVTDFSLDKEIMGNGQFGLVYKAQHTPSQQMMAIKKIKYNTLSDEPSGQESLVRELYVSTQTSKCPYTVQFYCSLFWEGEVWICMELMDTSLDKLYKVMKKNGRQLPENILGKIAVAVVNALHYLHHDLRVIHRDVKPSNILINRSGEVKLCDFGVCGKLNNSFVMSMNTGCKPYMSPERINPLAVEGRESYGIRSDVWSFGISMVELATAEFPYDKEASHKLFEQIRLVVDGPAPRLPVGKFSPDFDTFIEKCLDKELKTRATYQQLLEDPFIIKYTKEEVDVAGFVNEMLDQFDSQIVEMQRSMLGWNVQNNA